MHNIPGIAHWLARLAGNSKGVAEGGCEGNPDAIGTSRIIAVDPAECRRIDTMDNADKLHLDDHEVVMTFDDGPQPPHTDRILDILAAERVKATFFIIGYRTKKFPALVRRIYDEGHTIGTHTQNHPHLPQLPFAEAKKEIEDGIATAAAALGKRRALAPFVRSPYLESVDSVEDYLSSRGIMSWNMGIQAEDWTNISADDVVARALMNLERVGKGVLILHDIQPRTVLALPALLREMRHRGYRVAHVMPISAQIPKS